MSAGPYTDADCLGILDALFPLGAAGRDVMAALAPAGWVESPLLRIFHPTAEQRYRETQALWETLREIGAPGHSDPRRLREGFATGENDQPIEPVREVAELVGMCLWDVFSENHEVIDTYGNSVDLGSFRGSAGLIADWLERAGRRYDYLDFYMGTTLVRGRAELEPVYHLIFDRLRQRGFDWRYAFPRLYVVELAPAPDQDEARCREELRRSLDEVHAEAVTRALGEPPPSTVSAYRAVYGHFPAGWPTDRLSSAP